ncbi:MAG: hypothetical protein JRF57_13170 [Deltaproteobacteria bacterium]|nr:hypothetical protein [Deltaproteobacteria bacterium]MBW2304649.1 hypothetical protein [Deltaproteobacteria bacterium]
MMMPVLADPAFLDFQGTERNDYRTTRLSKVSASRTQDADITIITAEGDRVTLSATSESRLGYAAYTSYGRKADRIFGVQANVLHLEENRDFVLKVEGDLNSQEIRDIKKTLRTIDRIIKDVLRGDMERALERARKAVGLDSISAFEAEIQVQEVTTLEHRSTAETSHALLRPVGETTGKSHGKGPSKIDELADLMLELVKKSGLRKGKLLRPLGKLFSRLLENPGQDKGSIPEGLETAKKLQGKFLKKLEEWFGEEQVLHNIEEDQEVSAPEVESAAA